MQSKPTELEIVNGGAEVPVKFKGTPADPSPSERQMFIRIVPARSLRGLALAWGQEEKEIAIYLGLKEAESEAVLDTLHPDGWETVMTEGRRLNFTSFAKWQERSREAVRAINGGESEQGLVAAVVRELGKTEEGRAVVAAAQPATPK